MSTWRLAIAFCTELVALITRAANSPSHRAGVGSHASGDGLLLRTTCDFLFRVVVALLRVLMRLSIWLRHALKVLFLQLHVMRALREGVKSRHLAMPCGRQLLVLVNDIASCQLSVILAVLVKTCRQHRQNKFRAVSVLRVGPCRLTCRCSASWRRCAYGGHAAGSQRV